MPSKVASLFIDVIFQGGKNPIGTGMYGGVSIFMGGRRTAGIPCRIKSSGKVSMTASYDPTDRPDKRQPPV